MAGILHVCTANLIRSPIAEVLTRRYLAGYPIGSAGLQARPGLPIWPAAAGELARRGVPVPQHAIFRSRRLTPELASRADLVLTASRRHRDTLVATTPALFGGVFTWRELAWLTSGLTRDDVTGTTVSARIASLLLLVTTRRGYLVAPPGEDFDVADPVDGPEQALFETAEQISTALEAVLPLLAVPVRIPDGVPRPPHPDLQAPPAGGIPEAGRHRLDDAAVTFARS